MSSKFVRGDTALEDLLRKLPERLAKNVVTQSLRAGARVIRDGTARRAPRQTGELALSPVVSSARKATKDRATVVMGFKPPVSRRVHLTEFGTEHARAQPFIRPALDEDGGEAIAKIAETAARGVKREAAALAGGKKSFATGKRIR